MQKLISIRVLLAAFLLTAALSAQTALPPLDLAVTYSPTRANTVHANGSFWLHGGAVQAHSRLWRDLGAVVEFSGSHTASANNSGLGLDLYTLTAGPRYTWRAPNTRLTLYAQALVGGAFGRNSMFPNGAASPTSDNALAMRFGGGVDARLTHRISLRLVQADWQRTYLHNGDNNVQNSLRLGFGVVYRFR